MVTYYVLFFLHLETRRVHIAGITKHPDREWMEQIGRSATQETWGYLHPCRYVLHDRDTKFCASFRSALASGGVKTIPLPAKSPNLNAFSERWVRSVKQECLSKLILFGEGPLLRVLAEYNRHYHHERNHQGKDNRLLFPDVSERRYSSGRNVVCRQRLGGLLKYYQRTPPCLFSSVASASSLPSALRLSGAARVGKVGDVGRACSYLSPRSHRSCFSEHRLIPDTAGSPRNSSRYPPESWLAVSALAA